jgi:hypothetical protein
LGERLRLKHWTALAEALPKVYELMNFLGDFKNETDGVNEDDQEATDHAFARVKRVLAESLPPTTRNRT